MQSECTRCRYQYLLSSYQQWANADLIPPSLPVLPFQASESAPKDQHIILTRQTMLLLKHIAPACAPSVQKYTAEVTVLSVVKAAGFCSLPGQSCSIR